MTLGFLWRGLCHRVLAPLSTEEEAQVLRFPLPVAVRIALLDSSCGSARFRTGPNIRVFDVEDTEWLLAWEPEALVLPLGLALSLADQKQRGRFDLPSLNTALVVLTSMEDSPLADHHRDLLWAAFGVPVFEQLRGVEGGVIARECEVHDGLHIEAVEAMLHEGCEIVEGQCPCGVETPRLRKIAPVRARRAAASAL